VAAKKLNPDYVPDLSLTSPVMNIGPFPSWSDPKKVRRKKKKKTSLSFFTAQVEEYKIAYFLLYYGVHYSHGILLCCNTLKKNTHTQTKISDFIHRSFWTSDHTKLRSLAQKGMGYPTYHCRDEGSH